MVGGLQIEDVAPDTVIAGNHVHNNEMVGIFLSSTCPAALALPMGDAAGANKVGR